MLMWVLISEENDRNKGEIKCLTQLINFQYFYIFIYIKVVYTEDWCVHSGNRYRTDCNDDRDELRLSGARAHTHSTLYTYIQHNRMSFHILSWIKTIIIFLFSKCISRKNFLISHLNANTNYCPSVLRTLGQNPFHLSK